MTSLPFDLQSLVAIAMAAVCLGFCVTTQRSHSVRLAAILLAAFVIRADAAMQHGLHPWDERFHAVVAKHLIDAPLTPTLFPADHGDVSSTWESAHVWLHKPPLALWGMAASMSLFGVNEVALRLPSLLLGTLGVWLTYRIARVAANPDVALVAAYCHAVNGFLVSLGAGRRVSDHVDTLLIVVVQAAVLAVARESTVSRGRAAVCGALAGLGLLTKSFPGLLPLLLLGTRGEPRQGFSVGRIALAGVAAFSIAGPWLIYTAIAFPTETARETEYTLMHLVRPLEGHDGQWWFYLVDAPRFFGEQVFLALPALVMGALSSTPLAWLLGVWIAVPYVVFSASATKLPNLVMIAAPAIFVVNGLCWAWWRELAARQVGLRRLIFVASAGLTIVMPARYLLEPSGPFERRDRAPSRLRAYVRAEALAPRGDGVVFNAPDAVEAMFFLDLPVYGRMPTDAEVAALRAQGRRVIVFTSSARPVDVPDSWGASVIATD